MAPLYVWYFLIFIMPLSISLYHVISLAVSFSKYWSTEDLKAVPCLLHNTSLILVSLVLLKPPEDWSRSPPVPVACAVPGGPSPCWSPCSWPRRYRAPTRTRTGLGGSSLPEQIPQVCSLTQDRELCAQACPRPGRCIYSKSWLSHMSNKRLLAHPYIMPL